MNRKDFKRYMRQGLGRCVLSLHETDDIEKYKDIVLWGCLHNLSYDTQCEGTRAAYLYQLVSCFHDDAYFITPTIDAFWKLPQQSGWTFVHFCELLRLFAENGNDEAKNALYEKYKVLLSSLTVKRRFRTYDYERDQFEQICIDLIFLGGSDAFFKIAEDMGTLFKRNPHYDSSDFAQFFSASESNFGKKRFASLLKQGARQSENIFRLYENVRSVLPDSFVTVRKPMQAPQTDDLITEINTTGELSFASKVKFSRNAGENEKKRLALAVLEEEELSKKAGLLSAFQNEAFPIHHEELIAYSKSDHKQLCKTAFTVLTNCRSTVVRQYALELLASGENSYYAIQMLIFNYTPEDKPILLSALYRLGADNKDEPGRHGIGLHILDAFDRKLRLPKECLLYIYETSLCSCCREHAVRLLAKHRWLTADIMEECRYDSNCDIAGYINRYYPLYGKG